MELYHNKTSKSKCNLCYNFKNTKKGLIMMYNYSKYENATPKQIIHALTLAENLAFLLRHSIHNPCFIL